MPAAHALNPMGMAMAPAPKADQRKNALLLASDMDESPVVEGSC
jgi:hypothetical protein